MMESTIRLFKALPIKNKRKKKASKELLEKTLKRGFIFSPEVISNYSDYEELLKKVEKIYGITPEKLNASFHKSWKKIKEAKIEQLVLEQIIHYFTTYGFEALGIYDENSVYIPSEKLEIPKLKKGKIKLVVIKGYTKKELKEKLLKMLESGIALGEDTKNDVLDVATFVELDEKDIERVKNKEVRIALYDYLNLFPKNPVEFLRYIVYKSTERTLLIKNDELLEEIKGKKNLAVLKLLNRYKKEYGLERLAEIFYRFKPIFLAFKTGSQLSSIINKIRKLAVKYHKPMPEDYLNSITAKIKGGERITKKKLEEELSKVNTFRKIRLAYALKFRTKDVDSILYKIRNGKGWATDFEFSNKAQAKKVLKIVIDSIVKDVQKNIKGKTIYIPDYINYSLPATEKQFTGNFPSGTYVSIPKDMIFGIHWEDVDKHRIDLDLSVISPTEGKIGWDASYRTSGRSILFSGDMTEAHKPRGATELFYVKRQEKQDFILFVNYYNFDEGVDVPFKIVVAQEQPKNFRKNYMVDPNSVVSVVESKLDQPQRILGLAITTQDECRFYFAETNIGCSISSDYDKWTDHARKYLLDFYENTIGLREILEKAGAEILAEIPKDKRKSIDINLSPEELEKDTILNLLTK